MQYSLLMTVGTFILHLPLILYTLPSPLHKSTSSDRWPRSALKVKGHPITGGPHVRSDQCTWLPVLNSSTLVSLDTFFPIWHSGRGMVRWWCNEVGSTHIPSSSRRTLFTYSMCACVHRYFAADDQSTGGMGYVYVLYAFCLRQLTPL